MFLFVAINICDSIGLPHWFANKEGNYDDLDEYWFNWEHSDKSYLMWNVFWAISKTCLYIVYLQRIYIIFGDTKYAPSQSIYCVIVLILMAQFGLLSAWCWHYNIAWSCCEIWADNTYEILAWLAWWILIVDVLLTVLLIFLFLYCMKRLFQAIKTHSMPSSGVEMEVTVNSKSNQVETEQDEKSEDADKNELDGQRENKLVKRATQVFVLAIISLSSSIFYQFFFAIALSEEFYDSHTHTAFYYFSFTWNVDSTLNVICLFLSLTFGTKWYYKLCKCDACCYNYIEAKTT